MGIAFIAALLASTLVALTLTPVLCSYLLNGRNLADTARALKLHRNTVVYRVEKLAALLQVDFHALSEEQAFSYLFTCLLLKAQKIRPAR